MIYKLCLALAGLLLITNCTDKSSLNLSSKTVVKVNHCTLSLSDFSYSLAKKLKPFDSLTAKDSTHVNRAKEEVIKDFILNCLVLDWANENKITAQDEEITAELNKFRSQYKDDIALRAALAQEKTSLVDWKKQVEQSVLERKLFAQLNSKIQKPTEDEIKKFFDGNVDRYKVKESIFIKQIFTNEEGKAEIIRDELKKKSFEEVAKLYSLAPEASSGGQVGWVEKGTLDFVDQVFNQKIGTVSAIIKSEYGFHLIKVIDRHPARVKSYLDIKPSLEKEILAQREKAAYLTWIDSKLRQNKIFRDNTLINAVVIETRGL